MTSQIFEISECEPNSFSENIDIPKIDSTVSYDFFFKKYLLPNQPCIIQNVTDKWNSSIWWLKNGEVNFEYLKQKYGNSKVTVYNCQKKYFNSHKTSEWTFEEYLQYWKMNENVLDSSGGTVKYLKDWHLKNMYPEDDFYDVPIFFASDWLNEYLVGRGKDDYRFVYMGLKGTWTPFHADVFTSYSWSANVYGRKKWILFPPAEEHKLKDHLGNLYFDISEKLENVKYYEVIQETGEAIFVPSGWHHQVWNLENTISINHNWINGANVTIVWKSLVDNLEMVKKEIEDCKDMDNFNAHCQVMLNASFGMDFNTFYDFLAYIALRRLRVLQDNSCDILYNNFKIGKNHVIYDIKCIKSVLEMFLENQDVSIINFSHSIKPNELLKQITNNMNHCLHSE